MVLPTDVLFDVLNFGVCGTLRLHRVCLILVRLRFARFPCQRCFGNFLNNLLSGLGLGIGLGMYNIWLFSKSYFLSL